MLQVLDLLLFATFSFIYLHKLLSHYIEDGSRSSSSFRPDDCQIETFLLH